MSARPRKKAGFIHLRMISENMEAKRKTRAPKGQDGTKGQKIDIGRDYRLRSMALAERVKELQCLHSISNLFTNRFMDLGEILQTVANVLPRAWQHPEYACSCITLKEKKYMTANFPEVKWSQKADIVVNDVNVGRIEIGYTDLPSKQTAPVFLDEEKNLLMTVANRLADTYSLKETQQQISTYQERLRSLASELTLTEERERRQLAISLHDNISQSLAVAKIKLETLGNTLDDEHRGPFDDIMTLIRQIISDTRSITSDISPPILYELGFGQAIVWLADHFKKRFGLSVNVQGYTQDISLTESVKIMLFRSIQELLTNVVKHAHTTTATVYLINEGAEFRASVEDNGIGIDTEKHNCFPSAVSEFGLFSIKERITQIGGRMNITSNRGKGTSVHIWVPYSVSGSKNNPSGGKA